MTDNVVDLHKARRSQEDPNEAPDRFKSNNLRQPVRLGDELPADLVDGDVMARLGLDHVYWPGQSFTRIPTTTDLRELRDRFQELTDYLTRVIGDDGPDDFDPRGGAA